MASSIPRTMKALQLVRTAASEAPTLTLTEMPTPKPGPGQLLVKVHASAIHPSDQLNARGGFPLTTFPRVPGRDFAGVVVDGRPERIGQAVFGTSGYTQAFTEDGYQAEYAVVPEDGVAEKPAHVSFVQAATTGVPFTTADLILDAARPQTGETVLILGANGAVGRAAQVIAGARGLKVLRGVRGASGDVDTEGDPTLSAARSKTGGRGPDIVLDTVGQLALTQHALAALAAGGRLVVISAPRSGDREAKIDLLPFYRENKSFIGVNSITSSIAAMGARLRAMPHILASEPFQALSEHWEPVPLSEGVAAYAKAGSSRTKCVIVME